MSSKSWIVRLRNGTDPNVEGYHEMGTLWQVIALSEGRAATVSVLLGNGVNVHHKSDGGVHTAMLAAHVEGLKLMAVRLENGVIVHETDRYGGTALLWG